MTATEHQIETERLVLRLPRMEDFDRYAELHADEAATRFIGGVLPRAVAWRKFLQMPGAWQVQGFAMFSVLGKDDGRWLGQIGPWRPEGWPGNEIGWVFHPDAQGRGYAVEAGIAVIDWSFKTLGWSELIHSIDPGNAASQRLAQRLGSHRIGPGRLPPPSEDHPIELWGQTRAQWSARRTAP